MRLHSDWKLIARKAWSARFLYVASILSGAEAILPLFASSFPRDVFAGLTLFAVMGALISRFVLQERMHDET